MDRGNPLIWTIWGFRAPETLTSNAPVPMNELRSLVYINDVDPVVFGSIGSSKPTDMLEWAGRVNCRVIASGKASDLFPGAFSVIIPKLSMPKVRGPPVGLFAEKGPSRVPVSVRVTFCKVPRVGLNWGRCSGAEKSRLTGAAALPMEAVGSE